MAAGARPEELRAARGHEVKRAGHGEDRGGREHGGRATEGDANPEIRPRTGVKYVDLNRVSDAAYGDRGLLITYLK